MKARPTIFLSGVSHEFASFRDAVEIGIQKKGCFAENQSSFPPDYRTVEEMLRHKLHDSDAVIHIVGFRYGAEPKNRPAQAPQRSYTQMEFDLAREMERPVYVFLSDDPNVRDAPKADEKAEAAELKVLQKMHRDALRDTNNLYYFFKDKAELCKLVAEIPTVRSAGFQVDISRIIKYAPAELIGREDELKLLDDAWLKVRCAESPRPRVLTFVALGGEGKTSLVAKWLGKLAHQNWPGCDAAFAWSFYSQGTRELVAASSDLFLSEALKFFGDTAMAQSSASAVDKGKRLAQLVGERRALLVLDGVEPLQYAPGPPMNAKLRDDGIAELLKGLAAASNGLCVVTTRYSIPDLRAYWQTTAPEIELKRLSKEAGVALLRSLGVKGTQREFETLVEDVKGHALTLNLFGSYLRDAHAGDIRKRDHVKLEEADAEEQGGHAFRVMDAYVRTFVADGERGQRALALLNLIGLFDRPATADCLQALWQGEAIEGLTESLVGLNDAQRNIALARLEQSWLLAVNRDGANQLVSLDSHPLIREYFGKRLKQQPKTWRAAHRRLYEYLCESTKEVDQPTLEELQPLYQAVAHGCQAGLQRETFKIVYVDRILRGGTKYSIHKLGAFGPDLTAIACFFDEPWTHPWEGFDEIEKATLLNIAAFRLRSLSRISEAMELQEAAFLICEREKRFELASIHAGSVAGLRLIVGQIHEAIGIANRSLKNASFIQIEGTHVLNRSLLANALHCAGQRMEARLRFEEAEAIQRAYHPEHPYLMAEMGFDYCDLLLIIPERNAWLSTLELPLVEQSSTVLNICQQVSHRATQTLDWWTKQFLLNAYLTDFASNKLTLGRVMIYEAIVTQSSLAPCGDFLHAAVDSIRTTNDNILLINGLLTNAWCLFLQGRITGTDSAQSDLDEACEIAERGPMPLFLADIHLYRARLFGSWKREAKYPWQSPQHDLAEARRLIEKHGYWRRKEELEDAEEAAQNW